MRWFEDIAIGERAGFGAHEVRREDAIAFASQYDPQPFHLDDEAAAQTHFGRLAVSGWHTCAMTIALYVDHLRGDPLAIVGGSGVDRLRWVKPVYPGDTLRCETEVLDKSRAADRPFGKVRQQMTVFNQDDEVVLVYIAIVAIRCRDASEGGASVGQGVDGL